MNLHLIHMNIMDTLILQAAPPINTRPQTLAGLLSLHLLHARHYNYQSITISIVIEKEINNQMNLDLVNQKKD